MTAGMASRRSYSSHLRSIDWRRIRNRELLRAGYRCEDCGERGTGEGDLEVHHLHYGTVGEEESDDLRVLCRFCHKRRHNGRRGDPAVPAWRHENGWLAALLRGLVEGIDEFIASEPSIRRRHYESDHVMLGSTIWINDPEVIGKLGELSGACIVV